MLTAGVDGAGWHGGFDSSVSFRGGYSASYGDPIAGALGSTMGISGLQMAGAINSTMAGISSVTGIASRVGQVAGYAQRFAGGGGGGIAIPMGQMGSSISMPVQNSIYANQLTNVPPMCFKMGSQNNSIFATKHGGGGGNGGMNNGGGGNGLGF